ncbi:recombinase family protein [Vallitalea guaymasensis]|uniref:recombinase family protein n=1 Tax=Vallitalea guaymasensis TaxID=1185412 RepID=UPI000DE3FA20|nr:recombinase family protein [Vallitalea guaymasensis]
MERAALYIRVSTEEQTEYSPDAQKKQLIEFAKKNNYIIDYNHIFIDEGISGRKAEKRPAFMRMIGTAKIKPKQFDVILVHRFDRFSRNREDSVVYKSLLRKECGIKVISITEQLEDDKFSIILEAMLEAMAEYYSLNLADEVKKGMFEKANRGEHSGTVPLGYKLINKKLEVDFNYCKIIENIFSLFVDKGYSILDISRYLNNNNIRTKNNSLFTTRTLRYLLQNPCYYGAHRYNYRVGTKNIPNSKNDWIIIDNTHEPIISKELWQKAQDKLYTTKLLSPNKKQAQKYWLSGLLRCKHCGGSMSSNIIKGKYVTYFCNNRKNGSCKTPNNISLRKLEKLVIETMENDLKRGIVDAERISDKNGISELEILEIELKNVQRKYKLANKAFLAEIDTLEEYKEKKEGIRKEENIIIDKIKELNQTTTPDFDMLEFQKNIEMLKSNKITQLDKNKIIKEFVSRIVISSQEKYIKLHYYYMG